MERTLEGRLGVTPSGGRSGWVEGRGVMLNTATVVISILKPFGGAFSRHPMRAGNSAVATT
jgi:hypothetical protein